MAQPDRLDIKSGAQKDIQAPQTEETTQPPLKPALSGDSPSVLPRVDHRLFSVMGEAEQRLALLKAVTIEKNGIARTVNADSGVETMLAAVTVDSQKTATLVTFTRGEDGELLLPVKPYDRFGFFVGHKATGDVSGALRIGLYPGTPLVTQAVSDIENQEIFTGLRGIKEAEADERKWAEEVGLFSDLGFDPTKSRGVFNKFHRPNRTSETWQASPLVALPDGQLDLLAHFDPTKVRINEFQTLLYGTQDVVADPYAGLFPGLGDGYLGLRGSFRGGDTLGGLNSFEGGMRGVGVGFGKAESVTARTTSIKVNSLEGAFQVVVVSAQA